MSVTLMILAAGVGIGLWALAVGLFPPPPPLEEVLARLDPATPSAVPADAAGTGVEPNGWTARIGRPFVRPLRAAGLPTPALARDLAVLDRPVETHLAEKAAAALAGLLIPSTVGVLSALAGRPFPWTIPTGLAISLAAAGFVLPDTTVRADAARQRATFRHALSAYLSLIQILLAGGAGLESALTDAASVGDGWPFAALRRALATARETRITPWAALGRLGTDLQIVELVELADGITLAGTEGARVRTALDAKATALRVRQAQDAEADANATTERMSIPGVLLAFGFIVFLFYPALTQISHSL